MPKKSIRRGRHKDGPVMDTPEQIERCLNCPFAECNNCVMDKSRLQSIPSSFLTVYVESATDEEAASRLGKSVDSIMKYRRSYNLPAPRKLSMEDRRREVDRVVASGLPA